MARKQPEGTVFKDGRGLWTAVVELPRRDNKRRRRVIRSTDEDKVRRELRRLLNEKDKNGDLQTRVLSVEKWVNEWFAEIATEKIRPKTASTYRGLIDREIIPALGSIKLDKLTPADVRRMNRGIVSKGLSSTTAMQVHRILSVALKYAEREGHVGRNVAKLVDAPKKAATNLSALTVEDGMKVLRAAVGDPLESLWFAVLLTGARQGELLGMQPDRVTDSIEVSWQLQRLTWEHGCEPRCNRIRGSDCRQKKITAPADWQNKHLTGGLWLTRPKSVSGMRIVPLIEPLYSSIHRHIAADDGINPHSLVWHNPDGSPIDPRDQSRMWHELLKRAGVPDVRLHDGRHTTVDLLYEAGVPEDLIREIVGHSTRETTRGYKSRGNQKRLVSAMLQLSDLLETQRALTS